MTAQEVDLTWPIRECTPWCEKGDGHPGEHPDDRCCWSTFRTITLAHGEPGPYIDGIWRVNWCNVYLRREPEATEPDIVVHHEHDDSEIRFTLDEARKLAGVLAVLLAQAEVDRDIEE